MGLHDKVSGDMQYNLSQMCIWNPWGTTCQFLVYMISKGSEDMTLRSLHIWFLTKVRGVHLIRKTF